MPSLDGDQGQWNPLGDSAWLYRGTPSSALAWFHLLKNGTFSCITDVVMSFNSVSVFFDPTNGPMVFEELVTAASTELISPTTRPRAECLFEIPVHYGGAHGPDLESCAQVLRRTCDEVVALHTGAEYQVAAIGFSPGFPYLLGLPEELHLPRKPSPVAVAAGTVAIAGEQSGIYPVPSPGGWHQLGRTSVELFSPKGNPPSLLAPGDRVRFYPAEQASFHPVDPVERMEPVERMGISFLVAGALTTVQDFGRHGFRHLGVGTSGSIDFRASAVLNQLVGNPVTAAVLECAASGPVILFHETATVAWFGWSQHSGKLHRFVAGDCLDLANVAMNSSRGCIAISGGIEVSIILGSRSTDLRAGFGGHQGRALVVGDQLALGACQPPLSAFPLSERPAWFVPWQEGKFRRNVSHRPPGESCLTIRFLRGIDWEIFPESTRRCWSDQEFYVTARGNRTALHLAGPRLETTLETALMWSQPVIAGSVQIPPDGAPLVLLSECQTIGGYPQIAHIISADLPCLVAALPGRCIRFVEVSLDEARRAWVATQKETTAIHASLLLKLASS